MTIKIYRYIAYKYDPRGSYSELCTAVPTRMYENYWAIQAEVSQDWVSLSVLLWALFLLVTCKIREQFPRERFR